MKCKRLPVWMLLLAVLVACQSAPQAVAPTAPPTPPAPGKLRLFWVDSYAETDIWSQQVRTGFLETLARNGYSTVNGKLEMRVFSMDVRRAVSNEDLTAAALHVSELIQDFGPDMVVVAGDEATRAVIAYYPDRTMPFVFCGFVGNPAMYGLDLPNVTGVLEQLHPVQTVAIAYAFIKGTHQYMVLSDASMSGRARALAVYTDLGKSEYGATMATLEIVETWADWQTLVLEAGQKVDFIVLAGYQGIVDATGVLVDEQEVMRWMLQNSPVPVFALSNLAIVNGAVGGLVAYGYEEGVAVAERVLLLANGTPPADIAIAGPTRNLLAINLAAVRHWNLRVPITFPLAARIYRTLPAIEGGN